MFHNTPPVAEVLSFKSSGLSRHPFIPPRRNTRSKELHNFTDESRNLLWVNFRPGDAAPASTAARSGGRRFVILARVAIVMVDPRPKKTKSPVPKNEARYVRSPFGQQIKGTSKAYLPGPLPLIYIKSHFGPFRQWVSERATVLMRTPDDSNEDTFERISIPSQRRISFGAGPCRGCAWQPSEPSRDAVRARWGMLVPS